MIKNSHNGWDGSRLTAKGVAKKTRRKRIFHSKKAKKCANLPNSRLFVVYEGILRFYVDPSNRTGPCDFSFFFFIFFSLFFFCSPKKRQIAFVSAIWAGAAVPICTNRTPYSTARCYSSNTHGLVDTWLASQRRGHGPDSRERHFSVCPCIVSTKCLQ